MKLHDQLQLFLMNIVDIIRISVNINFVNLIYFSPYVSVCLSVCQGKIVNIYIKNLYPQIKYQFDQLLNASFHVWHNLSDDEKISLGTFIEQINNNQVKTR